MNATTQNRNFNHDFGHGAMTHTTRVLRFCCMLMIGSAMVGAPLYQIGAQAEPPIPPTRPLVPRTAESPSVSRVPRTRPTPPLRPRTETDWGSFAGAGFIDSYSTSWPELSSSLARLSAITAQLDAGRGMQRDGTLAQLREGALELQMADARLHAFGTAGYANVLGQTFDRISDRLMPSEASHPDDPADSLYREARKALSGDAYRRAAELFRRIRDQYPKSVYAPDAPYWEAFALQRLGTMSDLRSAQLALVVQEKQYPKASTRTDALALSTRIEGALARTGDRVAAQTLYGRASSASNDGCPKESEDERVDALNALMQVDAERAIPILKKVLARREPCTQHMRRTAVWLIASRKAPDAADVLMNVARTDPDKDVREQAVFWLANVPTEQAADMLIELVKGNGDDDLRSRAMYALSRSKSSKAPATLREIALDAAGDDNLRSQALRSYVSTMGRNSDDVMPFLTTMYGRADSRSLRSTVIQMVGALKSDKSRAFLMDIVTNPKESVDARSQALYSSDATGAQLAKMYDASSELQLKQQILAVLPNRKDNGGLDKLLDIARTEKNVDLRKQAISHLSRSKDPRALALLQEIIDR